MHPPVSVAFSAGIPMNTVCGIKARVEKGYLDSEHGNAVDLAAGLCYPVIKYTPHAGKASVRGLRTEFEMAVYSTRF